MAAVQRACSGQPAQAAPKVPRQGAVICRVVPAGQVTMPAAWPAVKSSMVNPPSTAGLRGGGLITTV
jgi:hypothetical protein